jgi:catechol 2,3-dioxygenase-like lactoylglutathione lyase family enzyme
MTTEFPAAVPEIPVAAIDTALEYYAGRLGFNVDWDDQGGGGIAAISGGYCRLFLTNAAFREHHGNAAPVVVWLNLDSKA